VRPFTAAEEFVDGAAAEVVQHRLGDHRAAGDVGFKRRQRERRVAEAVELFAEHRVGRGEFLRGLERLVSDGFGRMDAVGRGELERLADARDDAHVQRRAAGDGVAREGMFEPLAQRGVVGLPDDRADGDRAEVDVAAVELELERVPAAWRHRQDATALLVLLGVTFVKDDAVVRLQRARRHAPAAAEGDEDAIVRDALDGADAATAGFGKARGDELLVVDAGEETVGKSAGERLFQVGALLLADPE
jgi:hypothetical protein